MLESANPVRPSNAPHVDARTELRGVIDSSPALQASGSDFADRSRNLNPWERFGSRPWSVAVAAALFSALVIATVVLAHVLASLQPAPPAISPSPNLTGSDGWRVVQLSTTEVGGTTGPQIQLDLAPGFITSSDVPNESYDSLSIKIVRDTPTQDIFAQIYYGKVLPQRDPQACVAAPEKYVELDSIPADVPANSAPPGTASPRFVYRVVEGAGLKASFGITALPPGTAVDACTEYHHVESLPDGTLLAVSDHFQFNGLAAGWLSTASTSLAPTFSSIDEARAYMGTDEYQTYKRMLSSVRIIQPK